jgi:large subunit ribosomal protein L23
MNGNRLYGVLLTPRVTEKTARLSADSNQYVFEVASDAEKDDVRKAVEHMFDVNVESVRIVNVKGKTKSFKFRRGRRSDWKKAYVRIQEGQVIDVMGGEGQ